jgi:uncharacterized protein (TIGR03086 family)
MDGMTEISDRYRRLSKGFTARVEAVPADDDRWSNQSPCPDWTARDVVGHMLDTHQMFFGLVDHEVAPGPSADDDPAAAWAYVRDAMQAALDDESIAGREHEGMFGRSRWDASVDRFINTDVLVHTWDLARALGVDDRLDPAEVPAVLETAKAFGDAARGPQTFGPELPAPPDADDQDRLLAFVGRDPRA